MNIDELAEKAEANFHKHLVENSYPGRGIVIGCDPGGNPVLTVATGCSILIRREV